MLALLTCDDDRVEESLRVDSESNQTFTRITQCMLLVYYSLPFADGRN